MKKKILIFGSIGVVAIALLVMSLMSDNEAKVIVTSAEVESRDIIEIVSASGNVEPKTKVNITAQINGEIVRLAVKEGDPVSTGDLLIILDTVQLRSDVNQAKYNLNEVNARLEGARATLEQAKDAYDRQQRLFDKSLTSETAYSDAKYKYLNAKSTEKATAAQAKQSQFRYEKVMDNLGKATIVAPMNGVVTFVDCEVGEIAPAQTGFTQGKTLMTVSDLSLFEVEVEVDETYIGGKRRGGKRGRGADKMIVVSLVERKGEVVSKSFDMLTANELQDHIKEQVDKEARIMTDEFKSYKGLDKHFREHQTVRHGNKEYVRGEVYTNTAEGFFSLLKRGVNGTFHHISKQHLPFYLNEFDFRWNNRYITDGERMRKALKKIEGKRLIFREHTNNGTRQERQKDNQ